MEVLPEEEQRSLPEEEPRFLTEEEFDALPDDEGVDRWIIDGLLYEQPMTVRSFPHSRTEARIAYLLQRWLDQQPGVAGLVLSGEAGFRLRRRPATRVGIDVAYISAERMAATSSDASMIEGPPTLAVEILSPSDTAGIVTSKIKAYLQAGVPLVWRVEPIFKFITVFRPDAAPQGFNIDNELTAEPHLPGFRVAVSEIFE